MKYLSNIFNSFYNKGQKIICIISAFLVIILQPLAASSFSQCGATKKSPAELVGIYNNKRIYPKFTLICAHRGLWIHRNYPQNSAASFQAAVDAGIDCVENDIKWTKDNIPVIFHDPHMDMMVVDKNNNPVTGAINNYTLAQLKSFKLRDRVLNPTEYDVLTLKNFINITRGKIVENHEIKLKKREVGSKVYIKRMVELIKILDQNDVLVESIIKGELTSKEYKEVLNEVKIAGVAAEDITFVPKFFHETPNVEEEIATYNSLGINSYELVVENETSPLIQYFATLDRTHKRYGAFDLIPESGRGRFTSSNIWKKVDPTKDYRGNWNWIFSGGYTFIITDRPCLISQYLTQIGRRNM